MTDKNDEIKLMPARLGSWYWLVQKAIEQDAISPEPDGWHWLILLHYILDFNVADVQRELPDGHSLKSASLPSVSTRDTFKPIVEGFKRGGDFFSDTLEEIIEIDFSGLHFEKSIDFSNFIFPIYVSFEQSKFSGNVSFENAIFKSYSNFKETKFKRRASFQHAIFELHAPRFYGAKFNNEMTFAGMIPPKFETAKTDKLDKDGKTINDKKQIDKNYRKRIGENQNSYENTSTKLGNQKKYHDQHFFFREEMRCRRRLENYLIRPFYWLYEKLSNYGYGVGHAFGFWVGHIAIFSIVFMFLINDCWGYRDLEYWKNLSCSISISLSNATPVAFISFEESSLMKCYGKLKNIDSVLISTIKVTQTVLGILFLFLLLLTLRVRFRLK